MSRREQSWVLYSQRRLISRHGLFAAWEPSLFGYLHACIGYREFTKSVLDMHQAGSGYSTVIRTIMRGVMLEAGERYPGYSMKNLSALIYFGLLPVSRQTLLYPAVDMLLGSTTPASVLCNKTTHSPLIP